MNNRRKEISMTTKKRMAKLFMCIADQELSIELARQNLCNCSAFEPYSSFKRLDRHGQGYLTIHEIIDFIR
jgi:hypothetical protein